MRANQKASGFSVSGNDLRPEKIVLVNGRPGEGGCSKCKEWGDRPTLIHLGLLKHKLQRKLHLARSVRRKDIVECR